MEANKWAQSTTSATPDGNASNSAEQGFGVSRSNVSPKDIFVFAKWILAIASGVYFVLIILHVFEWKCLNEKAMQDVWDKTTVFLNSIITLVLGLYFGAKKEDARSG